MWEAGAVNGNDRCHFKAVQGVLNNDVSGLNLLMIICWNIHNIQDLQIYGKGSSIYFVVRHHPKVDEWRRQQSILRTMERRPDLEDANLTSTDKKYIRSLEEND
ncbi:MAG: hypothetical protein ACLT2Z_02245 [Eubacterium sp.]